LDRKNEFEYNRPVSVWRPIINAGIISPQERTYNFYPTLSQIKTFFFFFSSSSDKSWQKVVNKVGERLTGREKEVWVGAYKRE
jgi:hypothetical protein